MGVEPTKEIDCTSGCSSSRSTATLSRLTTLSTPSGSPASLHSWAIHRDADGSFSEGFSTTVFPDAMATGRNHNGTIDRKSTRLNSSHVKTSYAVFCLKKKITTHTDK